MLLPRLFWLVLAPALTVLLSCSPAPEQEKQVAPFEPPPAEAPPDAGVPPPQVRLHVPGGPPLSAEERPQRQLVDWSEALADGLNIPRAALQAYGYAQRALEQSMPECHLTWTVLAGIGAVESSHGRYGGAKLDQTGRPDRPVIGPALDGSPGVKRIEDTDGGELDGDEQWDRAVGPLQFIPESWREWGVDADGDGVADPNDIDDAAMAAARYLCSVGGDLQQPDRFWKALLTYNQSRDYVQEVINYADYYGKKSRKLLSGGVVTE
ncbi:lytic transglycosylase domain-containing protein [Saccharopolyspora rectivirgula]|jgi:membrane-bound lytic murein transglycosylase B|uniref:Murein transglycosylase n=1 Tax=Saccharopolyspora rectivirgula TaxID=28042 RepID=A0A073BD35_9PSEU|nr:lytic murein transglycosylase [Saccharopolyspora rectivirgula]KEI45634.1 murein transglycosylase [Saccharopolyspora rectivirgula]